MTTSSGTIIGVISDTHGLLRPQALGELRGSQAIIHAGDVGREEILYQLEQIAPLTVVRGNIDTSAWARKLPATNVLQSAGTSLYVIHNIDQLDLDPAAAGFSAVIFGHSHRPLIENRRGMCCGLKVIPSWTSKGSGVSLVEEYSDRTNPMFFNTIPTVR